MRIIRASEVGEYTYCARAWWLRRVAGWQPDGAARRAAGVARHARHGQLVHLSRALLLAAGALLLAGLLALWLP